jgi:hypothetical protein
LVVVFAASVNEYLDRFSHDVNLLNLVLMGCCSPTISE